MPMLVGASAHWDASALKVRYYANFEGTENWIEVPAEDFDRLTHLFAQEAIDVVCEAITETLDGVRTTLAEFSAFREGLEKMSAMTRSRAEGTEN